MVQSATTSASPMGRRRVRDSEKTVFDSPALDQQRVLVAGCDACLGGRKRGVRPSGTRRGFVGCANEPLTAKFKQLTPFRGSTIGGANPC